jgi:hypothetical protein
METKKFTQFGTFTVVIFLSLLIFSTVMIFTFGSNDKTQLSVYGFMSIISLICLLLFYQLSISVDDKYVSFSLGIGLIRKKFMIDTIQECKPVSNSPFYGIGIKKIPHGWLYNVSGLKAVELTFKNSDYIIRIGTNEPEKVAECINSHLDRRIAETTTEESNRSGFLTSLIIIALVIIFPVIVIFNGIKETEVIAGKEGISIKGMYGLDETYTGLLQLDTISVLPAIRIRTNGFQFGNTLRGNFTLSNGTKVKLFIRNGNPPYIFIRTNNLNIYLNKSDRKKTIELFDKIRKARSKY